jgi:hypothetical protein
LSFSYYDDATIRTAVDTLCRTFANVGS